MQLASAAERVKTPQLLPSLPWQWGEEAARVGNILRTLTGVSSGIPALLPTTAPHVPCSPPQNHGSL